MNVYAGIQALAEYERLRKRVQELENQIVLLKSSIAWVKTNMSDEATKEDV